MNGLISSTSWLRQTLRRLPLVVAALGSLPLGTEAAHTPQGEIFRVGFSHQMFVRVNEVDARASLSAFGSILAKERGVPTANEQGIYTHTSAIAEALRRREIDAIGLSVPELWILDKEFDFTDIIVDVSENQQFEHYVLLVRRDAGVKQLGDLRGKAYTTVTSVRLSLATVWLDLLLADAGLAPTGEFLEAPISHAKPNKALLPLFFGQADVCLISRRMLDAAVELNPQIASKVEVLASSPPLLPSVFAYDAHGDASIRNSTVTEIVKLHRTAAGRQILTILQAPQVDRRPLEILDPSFRLLDEHARRCPSSNAALIARLSQKPQPGETLD